MWDFYKYIFLVYIFHRAAGSFYMNPSFFGTRQTNNRHNFSVAFSETWIFFSFLSLAEVHFPWHYSGENCNTDRRKGENVENEEFVERKPQRTRIHTDHIAQWPGVDGPTQYRPTQPSQRGDRHVEAVGWTHQWRVGRVLYEDVDGKVSSKRTRTHNEDDSDDGYPLYTGVTDRTDGRQPVYSVYLAHPLYIAFFPCFSCHRGNSFLFGKKLIYCQISAQ